MAIRWERENLKATMAIDIRKLKASTTTTTRKPFSILIAIGRRPMTRQHRLASAVSFRRSKNRSRIWIPIKKWQYKYFTYANRAQLFLSTNTHLDLWTQPRRSFFVALIAKVFFSVVFLPSSMESFFLIWMKKLRRLKFKWAT